MLLSLLSNSIKFTRQGTIVVEAFFYKASKNSSELLSGAEENEMILEIKVSDRGIGMTEDKINEVFFQSE